MDFDASFFFFLPARQLRVSRLQKQTEREPGDGGTIVFWPLAILLVNLSICFGL